MAQFTLDIPISVANPQNLISDFFAHVAAHMRTEGFKSVGLPTIETGPLRLRLVVETDNAAPTPGTDLRQKLLSHFGMTKV